jgi:hypothetical protein
MELTDIEGQRTGRPDDVPGNERHVAIEQRGTGIFVKESKDLGDETRVVGTRGVEDAAPLGSGPIRDVVKQRLNPLPSGALHGFGRKLSPAFWGRKAEVGL